MYVLNIFKHDDGENSMKLYKYEVTKIGIVLDFNSLKHF